MLILSLLDLLYFFSINTKHQRSINDLLSFHLNRYNLTIWIKNKGIMLYSEWENFNRCSTTSIHVCKKLPLAMDCRQSKYALSKFNIYIFQFWTWLLPFLFYVIFRSSKSVSQILKISFQTGNINIFVLRGVFFSGYVQLKSSFSDEKNISGKIWDTL